MATHSSVLAWRIPGMREPSGLLSMGSHRVRHDWGDLAGPLGERPAAWRASRCRVQRAQPRRPRELQERLPAEAPRPGLSVDCPRLLPAGLRPRDSLASGGACGEGKHPVSLRWGGWALRGVGALAFQGRGPFRSWCQLVSRRDGLLAGLRPGADDRARLTPSRLGSGDAAAWPSPHSRAAFQGTAVTAPGRSPPGGSFSSRPPVRTHLKLEPRWGLCPLSTTRACSPGSPS